MAGGYVHTNDNMGRQVNPASFPPKVGFSSQTHKNLNFSFIQSIIHCEGVDALFWPVASARMSSSMSA
jgi:hypothetical protein